MRLQALQLLGDCQNIFFKNRYIKFSDKVLRHHMALIATRDSPHWLSTCLATDLQAGGAGRGGVLPPDCHRAPVRR